MISWAILSAALLGPAPGDLVDEPAIRVSLGQNRRAIEWAIGLFRGSRASDGASALANWKRATNGKGSLGKGIESAIAALNPGMAREVAVLDGAEFTLDFGPTGAPSWSFVVPKDDGTVSAFATAMSLTDGAAEIPLRDAAVDRLGPKPGASLMARSGDAVVVGDSRASLERGLARVKPLVAEGPEGAVPVILVNAEGLARSARPEIRRIAEALRGFGMSHATVTPLLRPARVNLDFLADAPKDARLEPLDVAWLADVPSDVSLAFAVGIDARREAWDRLFATADRVEKADPANAGRAPLRARIGVACRLAGLDVEADLWPRMRGLSGFLVGEWRAPRGAALAVHVADDASAVDLRDRVFPRMARAFGLQAPAMRDDEPKPLARISGKDLRITAKGRTVWIAWGDEGRAAAPGAARLLDSLSDAERASFGKVGRQGWCFPARLGIAPQGSALSAALDRADPIRWVGTRRDGIEFNTLDWRGLDRAVARFLELVPQEPPAPEH